MISVNDLRTGVTVEIDGEIYSVVDFLHVKPGKGAAFVRTKLKNIRTGSSVEKTFRAGERLPGPTSVQSKCSTSMLLTGSISSWIWKPMIRFL